MSTNSPQLWRINEKIIWRIQYNVTRTRQVNLLSQSALLPPELMRIFIAPEIWPASLMISIILRWKRAPQPQTLCRIMHSRLLSYSVRILHILIHTVGARSLGSRSSYGARQIREVELCCTAACACSIYGRSLLQQHQVKRSCMHAADRRVVSKKCPVVFSFPSQESRV